jgi:hypothetical protein
VAVSRLELLLVFGFLLKIAEHPFLLKIYRLLCIHDHHLLTLAQLHCSSTLHPETPAPKENSPVIKTQNPLDAHAGDSRR